MEGFTKSQVEKAAEAKQLYAKLAYPSMKDFEWAVLTNQIQNCPITKADIKAAQVIWGKDICALKGKTVRGKAPKVEGITLQLPPEIKEQNKEVFLTLDVFFVNKIPFLVTLSRKIVFTTANHLANRKMATIFKAFKEIYKYYLQRGFRITEVHADHEFDALRSFVNDMPRAPRLNITSADEHVPEVERRIRVIKERVRAVRHSLPFDRVPRMITIHMVLHVVKILNYFPTKGGISAT
jgi:hypothetical protein